jgi:hypothetical protein
MTSKVRRLPSRPGFAPASSSTCVTCSCFMGLASRRGRWRYCSKYTHICRSCALATDQPHRAQHRFQPLRDHIAIRPISCFLCRCSPVRCRWVEDRWHQGKVLRTHPNGFRALKVEFQSCRIQCSNGPRLSDDGLECVLGSTINRRLVLTHYTLPRQVPRHPAAVITAAMDSGQFETAAILSFQL